MSLREFSGVLFVVVACARLGMYGDNTIDLTETRTTKYRKLKNNDYLVCGQYGYERIDNDVVTSSVWGVSLRPTTLKFRPWSDVTQK